MAKWFGFGTRLTLKVASVVEAKSHEVGKGECHLGSRFKNDPNSKKLSKEKGSVT